jgi:hypothetical protein
MATFFFSCNNGVTAVVTEEDAKKEALIRQSGGEPIKAGVRVFTFVHPNRTHEDIWTRVVMTGTTEQLTKMIKAGGHELLDHGSHGWSGNVPFSNGFERSGVEEIRMSELAHRTTLEDVAKAFGPKSMAALCEAD